MSLAQAGTLSALAPGNAGAAGIANASAGSGQACHRPTCRRPHTLSDVVATRAIICHSPVALLIDRRAPT